MTKLRRFITPIMVIILLAILVVQLVVSAKTDSATADEPIHLLSGYATLTQHHMLFDPEHPFLVKAIAAIPLLWLQPHIPDQALDLQPTQTDIDYNTYYQANQWGWELLFQGSDDPYQVLFAARVMMMFITLGLALVLFWWARQLFGTTPALLVLALFSFDPNIIAHGKLINTDIGASLFFIGVLASFWNFLQHRNYRWLVITGIVLGLGMLTKFSLGMLAIILPVLTAIWLTYHRHQLAAIAPLPFRHLTANIHAHSPRVWIQYIASVASIGLIALALIWLGYGTLMLLNPDQNPAQRPDILQPAGTILTILPPTYAKGVANIVAPNRQGYLLGQCFEGSRWDYFPLLSLFKTPLPTLLLVMAGVGWYLLRRFRPPTPGLTFASYFFIVPTVVYLAISGLTGINIGIRHIFPIYILLLIGAGYGLSRLLRFGHQRRQAKLVLTACIVLVGSVAISSFMAWPYYLPYYNILAQEPQAIPFVADDSNTDWGQGTKVLAAYVSQQQIDSIAFDNFISRAEADYLHIPYTSADPDNHSYTGYLAISRSTITNHICQRNNDWGWVIDHHQPVAILGGAINVYYLQ